MISDFRGVLFVPASYRAAQAAMRQATRAWEKPRGSRTVVRPLEPEPEPEELSLDAGYDDEPEPAYRPPPRAPGARPGDKLRRIAAYSAAASAGMAQKAAPAPRSASAPWSLKELLDALAQEYEMAAS